MKHTIYTNKKTSGLLALVMGLGLSLSPERANAQDGSQIGADCFFGFTNTVSGRRGGDNNVRAAIRQGLARANRANSNSRTRVYFGNLGAQKFSYNDSSGDLRAHFNDWRSGNVGRAGGRTKIQWEQERHADLVCFITRGGGIRGRASINGIQSIVTEGQIQFHTMGHEFGHNYGCRHEGGFSFNSGGRRRNTFLASGGQGNGSIIDYFSNPFVQFDGQAVGVNPNKYNALVMFNSRFTRANKRTGLYDGGNVYFKSHRDAFWQFQGAPGGRMSARGGLARDNERFAVRREGNQWAFRGRNNRWVSSEAGNAAGMNCNRTRIGGWERFNLNVSNGQVALQGVGGWVSDNNNAVGGSIPMTADRPRIGGWERYYILRP